MEYTCSCRSYRCFLEGSLSRKDSILSDCMSFYTQIGLALNGRKDQTSYMFTMLWTITLKCRALLTGTSQSRYHVPKWFFCLTGKETSLRDVVSLLQADVELMKQQYELINQEHAYQIKELVARNMELKTRIGILEGRGNGKSALTELYRECYKTSWYESF